MRWLRHEPVQTGLPVFHPQKGQDPHTAGVSAGHGHADADLPFHPIGHRNSQRQHQKSPAGLFHHQRQDLGERYPGAYGEPDS